MDQLEFQLDVNFVSHVGIYVAYDLAQSAQLPPDKTCVDLVCQLKQVLCLIVRVDCGVWLCFNLRTLEMEHWFKSGTADMATTKSKQKRMYVALCSSQNAAGWMPVQVACIS